MVSRATLLPLAHPAHLPTAPTLELAVDVLAVGLDIQVQGQCLVGILGQLGGHTGRGCTPRSHPSPTVARVVPSQPRGSRGRFSLWLEAGASEIQRVTLIPGT